MSSRAPNPNKKLSNPKFQQEHKGGSSGKNLQSPNERRSSGGKQRRGQSTTRQPRAIQSGGVPTLAKALGNALRGSPDDDVVNHSLTHHLHTYPARMHPATARSLVELFLNSKRSLPRVVLDPFCGSGTTLVEARAAGIDVIGADLNPLAVRIARAKIWSPEKTRLDQLRNRGQIITAATIAEGKAARRADYTPRPYRVAKGINRERRNEDIASWFAPHVRRELELIASHIDEIQLVDKEFASLLSVCLSSILVKCSKRTSDTSSKIKQRTIARGAPSRWFGEKVQLLCEGIVDLHNSGATGSTQILEHDARTLDQATIPHQSIGAIISSPPYVGTYDYVDHHRLRLAFLGIPFQQFERSEIGARRGFKGRAPKATAEAYDDFRACLNSASKLLVPGGFMALMVGDSVAGREPMWADELLRDISGSRFRLLAWANQERDKLGSLEKNAYGDRAKREHILLFERTQTM